MEGSNTEKTATQHLEASIMLIRGMYDLLSIDLFAGCAVCFSCEPPLTLWWVSGDTVVFEPFLLLSVRTCIFL